jgi:hypothetical protein
MSSRFYRRNNQVNFIGDRIIDLRLARHQPTNRFMDGSLYS